MVRYRRKLVLIIISLPILVTVITAFRLRDVPKKINIDVEKEKCDKCDVKNFIREDQIQSARRSYEHLKKVARGKQQEINKEKIESKQFYKVDKNDNDESEDEESNFIESHKKDHVIRFGKSSIELKSEPKLKSNKLFSLNIKDGRYENDDEEEDDDDDDNDDDESEDISVIKSKGRKSELRVHKSSVSLEEKNVKRIEEKNSVFTFHSKLNHEGDGYESDDEDDDKKDSNESIDSEVLIKYSEEQISPEKIKKTANKNVKHYYDGNNTKTLRKNISDHKDNAHSEGDNDNEISYDDNDRIFLTLSVKTNQHLDNSQNPLIDKNPDTKQIEKPTVHFINDVKVGDKHDNETKTSSSNFTTKMNDTISKQKKNISLDEKPDSLGKVKNNISVKEKPVGVKKKPEKEVISVTDKKESHPDTKVATSSNLKSKSSQDVIRQDDELKPQKKKKGVHDEFSVKLEKTYTAINSEDKKKENQVVKTSNLDLHKQIPIEMKDKEKYSKSKKIESEEILSRNKFSNVTNASFRRNLHQIGFEDLYSFFPTFAPNFSHIHNPECRRHGQILLRQLRGTKLWAMNMFDATAKIPSGVLQGNGIQFGDFDQCLGSHARVQLDPETVVRVQGKYCLVRLDLKAEHPDLEVPVNIIQGKNLIKSRINDPGHFVPRFSTLSWGVCVPAACTPDDAEVVVRDALKDYHHASGVAIKVKVQEDDCHILNTDQWEKWMELPTVLTLSFYGVIVLLVILATGQDLFSGETGDSRPKSEKESQIEDEKKDMEDKKHQDRPVSDSYLSAFSLCRNVKKLLSPCGPEEISCIHGIRALATLALLVAHKFLTIAVSPYTNRIKLAETVSSPLWSWCRAGWVYTDCFLLLSGVLTAHRVSADRNTAAPVRLLWRYLRLTPALLAVLLFYSYIWNNIGSGPMWGTLVKKNVDICNGSWWWNMLYIQNYFGFEEMCAPQTHQLALDMQLTVLGGVLIWISEVKPRWSLVFFPAIHVMAAYFRYSTVRDHRLTLLAYHGVSVSQLYRTARLSYSSTLHRCSPYLIGISLGLALQKPPLQNKIVIFFGWLIGAFLWGSVWWAGFDSGSMQYQYNASFAAQYATLAPLASAVPIAWLIYSVQNRHCEILFRFLSSRFLVVISRLSYAIYLTQFVVYFTNAAMIRTASEFTLLSSVDVKELSVILIVSVVLTLLFIIPMQTIHKIASITVSKSDDSGIKDKDLNVKTDQVETQKKENLEKVKDAPYLHSRQKFLAHREFLEEIPESEIKCEYKRKRNEELEEILEEEEEDEFMEEHMQNYFEEEETEINEGGENMVWRDREGEEDHINVVEDERDLDEWEWTAHGNDQDRHEYYRYNR